MSFISKILPVTLLLILAGAVLAQEPPSAPTQGERRQGPRGGEMRMRGTGGQITAINGSSYVVKTLDGKTATIETTSDTKFMRQGQEISPKELKVGDYIMAGSEGEATGDTIKATVVRAIPPERVKQMQQMRENFGKTFTAGEIKSIDETKLTILRPDGQTQVIEVDENTSFKRGQDSITLADIKVGERVMAQGELKNGVFVPKTLHVGMQPMQPYQR